MNAASLAPGFRRRWPSRDCRVARGCAHSVAGRKLFIEVICIAALPNAVSTFGTTSGIVSAPGLADLMADPWSDPSETVDTARLDEESVSARTINKNKGLAGFSSCFARSRLTLGSKERTVFELIAFTLGLTVRSSSS